MAETSRQAVCTAGIPPPLSSRSFWHTKPSPLLVGHRSTRDLPANADIVIIGSGITGASVAHHLLDPQPAPVQQKGGGLKVVMLEAREACWGATGRNGGHCLPVAWEHPLDPSIGRFEMANFNAIQQLVQEHQIACEFVAQPGVRGLYSQAHVDKVRESLSTLQETAPELSEHLCLVTEPSELVQLRLPTAIAAVVTDTAARMWPYLFVAAVLERLLKSHPLKHDRTFNLQTLTPVTAISRNAGGSSWVVQTPRGDISASKVILATNAYTSHLVPSFSSLIVPCRGQMSALVPPSNLRDKSRLTTSFGFLGPGLDDYLIQRPDPEGYLMFGGGRQMGPSLGTVDDSIVDANVATYLRRRLVEAIGAQPEEGAGLGSRSSEQHQGKETELTAVNEWTGIMGFSRDDLPWVGEVPTTLLQKKHVLNPLASDDRDSNTSGLFMAAGYTGHGMPNAWLCGKAVAMMVDLASRAGPGTDLEQFQDHVNETDSLQLVQRATDLPDSYLITTERVENALRSETVETRDWAEMNRSF